MKFPKVKLTDSNSFQAITSLVIIATGLIIALGIMIPSGVFQKAISSAVSLWPKFPSYQSVKGIADNAKVEDIITSQPKLSFKKNVRFVVIETGDLNCSTCAGLHATTTKTATFYSKFLRDYIESGKVDYIWIDNQTSADIRKHEAMYCVGEQSAKRFFDFKAVMYKRYNAGFDMNALKREVKSLGLNTKKFEDCLNSKKYETRVKDLTAFSKETLAVSVNPSFTVYKVESQPVQKLDGKTSSEIIAKEVGKVDPTKDYDILFKSQLDALLK